MYSINILITFIQFMTKTKLRKELKGHGNNTGVLFLRICNKQ